MTLVRLLLILSVIASAISPAVGGDEQDCFQGQQPDLRIKGCSDFIQRNPSDSAGYHNRAVAYSLSGDLDRAIADYSKVIEIVPDNASAYDNRGRAYASKGDLALAAEDQAKAQALLAKAVGQPAAVTPKAKARADTRKKTDTPKNADAPKKVKPAAKAKAPPQAGNGVAQEAPASGFWSWLTPWNNNSGQPAGKKANQ
jgi:tetratricopeptide (TPR) repeat protein